MAHCTSGNKEVLQYAAGGYGFSLCSLETVICSCWNSPSFLTSLSFHLQSVKWPCTGKKDTDSPSLFFFLQTFLITKLSSCRFWRVICSLIHIKKYSGLETVYRIFFPFCLSDFVGFFPAFGIWKHGITIIEILVYPSWDVIFNVWASCSKSVCSLRECYWSPVPYALLGGCRHCTWGSIWEGSRCY